MDNYEKAVLKAAEAFKMLDPSAMAAKTGVNIDSEYIYVPFCFGNYKIDRSSGMVFADSGRSADFNEAMSLYDLLSFSKPGAVPSGTYCRLNSLHGMSKLTAPMDGRLCNSLIGLVKGREEKLKAALEKLGGSAFGKGDIAYRLPLFKELCFCVCYWLEDDEFPAQMYFMYDENMLSYFRFETVWYVAGIIIDRLQAEIEASLR